MSGASHPPASLTPQTPQSCLAPLSAIGTPVRTLVVIGALSCAALTTVCWAAGHVHATPSLLTGARFLHLASLVVGLGSVLAVDWHAILWVLGRRRLSDVVQTASALHVPIWGGLAGLVLSGMFLKPNLESPLTWVKLGLVLVVTLNGLYAHWLGQRLAPVGAVPVPRRLLVRCATAATVSQCGWWGATFIGFLNSQS